MARTRAQKFNVYLCLLFASRPIGIGAACIPPMPTTYVPSGNVTPRRPCNASYMASNRARGGRGSRWPRTITWNDRLSNGCLTLGRSEERRVGGEGTRRRGEDREAEERG